jgi:hypothetical protein
MDMHLQFQKPMKAWYIMKSNAFATSRSFTGAMKANGQHLPLGLERKMVKFDLS